jgi:hypothetical protein
MAAFENVVVGMAVIDLAGKWTCGDGPIAFPLTFAISRY